MCPEKAEILRNLHSMRAVWQSAVDRIPLTRMLDHSGPNPWTAKDEIAHVTFYDRRMAGRLLALARGDEPRHAESYDHPDPMPGYAGYLDAFNEIIRRRYLGMPAEAVLDAAGRAFADLVVAVEALPDDCFTRPATFTGEWTLAAFMPRATWVHYARHLPPLEDFIARLPG